MILALENVVFGIDTALAGKAATGHDHVIAGVQGLQEELSALSGAISALQTPTLAALEDVNVQSAVDGQVLLFIGATWQAAKISSANVTFGTTGTVEGQINTISASLSGKADVVHTHAISNVIGLQSALDGKASNAAVNAKLASNATAVNADKVDGLHGSQFIRSDADDTVNGTTEWQDNREVRLGSSADMRLRHDGTNSFIENHTGTLHIIARRHGGHFVLGVEKSDGGYRTVFQSVGGSAQARLNYDGAQRLITDSAGVVVSGRLHADDRLYVGSNGSGDSWCDFYDDNSNTWRSLGWDDSANAFVAEENDGGSHKLALVYDGSSNSNTNYPIGTTIAAYGPFVNRNASKTIHLGTAADFYTSDSGLSLGAVITGTWRQRGLIGNDPRSVFQRVA